MGKANGTTYEWDVEELIVEDGEQIDIEHNHFDTLAEAQAFAKQLSAPTRIALVRNSFRDWGWTDDHRCWAYLTNGVLPTEFTEPNAAGEYVSNGIRVPKRFFTEVAR